MKTVTVEWRHLEKEGKTCDRCDATGQDIKALAQRLQEEYRSKGVEILFLETKLSETEIEQSNLILINGKPIETLLPLTTVSENPCCSCTELTGRQESCRTIIRNGRTHEAVPREFIREAICRVADCC